MGKLLKRKIESNGKFDVILTRNRDIFLKLRERTKIAKKSNPTFLFLCMPITIKTKELEEYHYTPFLRTHLTKRSRLARRENKSDLFGNVDLSDETSEVTNILIDLTKRETLNQSSHLVNFLIKEFKNEMNLLQRTHRFAGFVKF